MGDQDVSKALFVLQSCCSMWDRISVFIGDMREEHCIVALYEWIAKMGMVVCLCMRYDYKEQIKEKSGYQELFFFLASFSSSFVRAASESGKL